MARKKVSNESGEVVVANLSMADLYALYTFVSSNRGKGFRIMPLEVKLAVDKKFIEVEDELYKRAYGCNPFKESVIVHEGVKPEDINLNLFDKHDKENIETPERFVVKTNEVIDEPKDEKPQTFAVFKNE
jgi:hypothetical protein